MPISSLATEKRHYLPLLAWPSGVLLAWVIWGSAWPRWVVMWMVALAFFAGCKWLTWRAARPDGVPIWRQAAYLLLWPGLDAEAFLFNGSLLRRKLPTPSAWWLATFNLIFGAALFWVCARQWPTTWWWARGWTGMTGFILAAHCGIFQILSYIWQTVGLDARPLMNWPLCSCNVSEFWGQRWNTAFRDFAHRFLFQPLAQRCGPRYALLVGFFLAGWCMSWW